MRPIPLRQSRRRLAHRSVATTILCLLGLLFAVLAASADYSFSIPNMDLSVTVQPDASVRLSYAITFVCNPSGDPIDVVDIGLPHADYDISNMAAFLDGAPCPDIRKSTVVTPGVEVHLPAPIRPGQQGKFQFRCTMPNLVYQDTTNPNNASLRITPTWYDGEYLTGQTNLWIIVELPISVKPEEILYQLNQPFKNKGTSKQSTFAAWQFPSTRLDKPHMVGLSFPKRVMERVVHQTAWGLAWKWWKENSGVRVFWALVLLVLLGVWFFRLTRGTGCTLYGLLLIALVIAWAVSPALEALALPALVMVWVLTARTQAARRRDYLPAIASTPGGGIKRGLTAPEAAVLLELPLNRVLTLVIFGLLKKGLVRQTQAQPLTVELEKGYEGGAAARRETAKARGTVIRGYEQEFLDVIAANPGKPLQDMDFSKAMKNLIHGTAARLAGFDLEQTQEYYKSIMAKAWQEAKGLGDISARTSYLDENLLWLMMAPTWDDEFESWHRSGYYYRPVWTRPVSTGGTLPSAPTPAVGGRTSLSDVAASFAGWAENVSGRLAGAVDPASMGLRGAGVDLSGVDRVTGEILQSLASSSGSGGGGGGGGCACACAGCACACACAGGGR